MTTSAEAIARRIHVRGVVQGVGFRPYVWRLARAHAVRGWVRNASDGVHIHVEGDAARVDAFAADLLRQPPDAAVIGSFTAIPAVPQFAAAFDIVESRVDDPPTTRISPDLPVCDRCLRDMRDPSDRRFRYPYINCTDCGPRYSIVRELPYDRVGTTMAEWTLCEECGAEYADPADRRFHAQPIACPACGPEYVLLGADDQFLRGDEAVREAAQLLCSGRIVAIKGIGGYHLACDAENATAVAALRERKFRKEQPFAMMTRNLDVADDTIEITPDVEALLTSTARPIVLAPARLRLAGVAPDQHDLGVMLPYAPLHHLLFDAGAPPRLVMTSGNRSSEPIACEDEDAFRRLEGIADAFLTGERPIARRVDDSVTRVGALGPTVLRRSRGLAPSVVATLPTSTPILAVGGDLKNVVTLVVDGSAIVSQHIGDLSHYGVLQAFDETIRDLLQMYGVRLADVVVVHDAHPQYRSAAHAISLDAGRTVAVQHHRAHVASVLAERGALERRVIGLALDGTGYGDDGGIWGGEVFVGSVRGGFERVAHLRPAMLPGGDAAARYPVQAAAGFLEQIDQSNDVRRTPFCFPDRYLQARALVRNNVRTFPTTSAGRLFDTVAALVGFTRGVTFEGQAAMWLEQLARSAVQDATTFEITVGGGEIDWRPALVEIVHARMRGVPPEIVARAFHRALARGLAAAVMAEANTAGVTTVVLSGGVMQNQLLVADLRDEFADASLDLWTNRQVPPNDGGLSLGQAALGAV